MKLLLKKGLLLFVSVMMILSLLPKSASAVAYDPVSSYESLDIRFWEDEKPPIGFYINASSRYILETVTAPKMGSTFGEWSVMDLLRGKYTGYDYINHIPDNYFIDYIAGIEQYVKEKNGALDRNKSTEWSRLILALSALGYDIRNVAGYNFVEKLSQSYKFSYRQGINGPIWELIALNTGGYQLYPDSTNADVNTSGKMINYILNKEITQSDGTVGGWALSGKKPDPDITGMALQALAPYYSDENRYNQTGAQASYSEFAKAVERAIAVLVKIQEPNGGYGSLGTANSESTVQVIVALTTLNIDPLASSIRLPNIGQTVDFITEGSHQDGVQTNNMIDALLTFWAPGSGSSAEVGGFKHVTTGYDGGGGSGHGVNAMATDQALYGLIAYDRFLKGEKPLYDMTDMINGEYKTMKAASYSVTFDGNNVSSSSMQSKSPYASIIIPWEAGVYSWNTKADGTGTKYLPGEKLVMPEKNITLFAQSESGSNNDTQNVMKVIELIDALPALASVTREHENQIVRARAAYQKLSEIDQAKVTNVSVLVTIEGKLNQLLAQYDDELKVTNLIQTIDALSSVNPLTADYELAIDNARRSYNSLTATQRLQITNISKLQILEAQIAILVEQAKQEQEAAVDAEDRTKNTATAVIAMINALPALENLTLDHLLDVRKARIYYDALQATEKEKVTNSGRLIELEKKLDQLSKDALEQEEFEDETDFDSFHEMTIKGKTLTIESNKSAGDFHVEIPTDVLDSLSSYKLSTLEIKDQRGVKLEINAAELLAALNKINNVASLKIEIFQYDYDTGLFEMKLQAVDQKGTSHPIKMSKSYIKISIPYRFFVDGEALNEKILFRVDSSTNKAISHVSNSKTITINVKEDGIFKFTNNTVRFTDVAGVSTKEEIHYLADRGVINGTQVGIFSPHTDITRAQFAVLVARALGLTAQSNQSQFKDVKGAWYEQEVQALYESGITKGTTATTFNPNGKLTRQQAALIMARALRYAGIDTNTIKANSNYKDVNQISKEALNDIGVLKSLEIMSGNGSNQFMPHANLTRAQMAKILKRSLGVAEMM